MQQLTERELVEKLKAKDPVAFTEFVRRFEGRVFNYGLRMCGDREDALEVTQETFMRAYSAIADFREDARLTTWLFRIVANSCLMKRRRSKFAPTQFVYLDAPLEDSSGRIDIEDMRADVIQEAMDRQIREALDEALKELPAPYRSVFLLRDVEHLSTLEVAEILDLTEAAVKTRLHRARLFLRERLLPLVEATY